MAKKESPTISSAGPSLYFKGAWTVRTIRILPQKLKGEFTQPLIIDGQGIIELDTAGALLLNQYFAELDTNKVDYALTGFQKDWSDLLHFVAANQPQERPIKPHRHGFFELLGRESIGKFGQFFHFFDFLGRLSFIAARATFRPRRFHFASIISTIERAGLQSLPIVALLCFLIGVVLAYQLGMQLKNYGANIFMVYLTGVAILREFGPLITAIILAGRTSSAFTAEIGSMKVNQEIDALLTMGFFPSEFLVLPKVLGLIIIFPLLIFWADVFGVLGSMLMAQVSLGIDPYSFLTEFANSVELKQLLIGLSKAPVFSLIIGLVGCYQGFQVEYSADSVGKKTTKSVVQAIFLIIIADAAFSTLYSMLGL